MTTATLPGQSPANKMHQTSVLIVDDHPIVRRGLAGFLALDERIQVVGEAGNAAEAIRALETHEPDVILMDLMMPGMDGLTPIRKISQAHPHIHIIVLTSVLAGALDHPGVFEALQAGARGYFFKDARAGMISQAVVSVSQNNIQLHPEAARLLMKELHVPEMPHPLNACDSEMLGLHRKRLVALEC